MEPEKENKIKELNFKKLLKLGKEFVDEIEWDNRNKQIFGCGICLSICGLITILLSFVFFLTIGSLITSGIIDNAVVTGPSSPGYAFWYNNTSPDSPPEYECYNFFNLTNVDEVMSGGTPIYTEKGPYCYQVFKQKINITFSDDQNTVTRTIQNSYQWAPEASLGNSRDDVFVNLSPGYLGILAGTKGEEGLIAGFVGPSLQYNVIWLTNVFVHHIRIENLASNLLSKQGDLLNTTTLSDFYSIWANATSNPTTDWNGMVVSIGETPSEISNDTANQMWDKKDQYSFVNNNNFAQEIWFNATFPTVVYPLGFERPVNPSVEARAAIQAHYNLTTTQMNQVMNWMITSFFTIILDPVLIDKYSTREDKLETVEDIGWLQWATCTVTSLRKSAAEVYYFAPGGIPDYSCFRSSLLPISGRLSVSQAKQLTQGPLGIFSMVNLPIFFEDLIKGLSQNCSTGDESRNNTGCTNCSGCEYLACFGDEYTCNWTSQNITCDYYEPINGTGNCTTTYVPYNTTCSACTSCLFNVTVNDTYSECSSCSLCDAPKCPTEKGKVNCESCSNSTHCFNTDDWRYINDTWGISIEETVPLLLYLNYTHDFYSQKYLEKLLFGAGGGLFPRRTLDQWIFHAEDPLMYLANPTDPGAGDLIVNQTMERAQKVPSSTLYTGKQNVSMVAHYISWGNVTEIPYPFYAENVPIHGSDEWGQFPPLMQENNVKTLTSWDPNYIRPVTIEKVGEVKYRDVLLWRFMVQNDTLLPNPLYYQSVQGFANSTQFHYGSPIFYSNPHYAGCDDTYAHKVIGVVEGRNWESDYTVVDIEPNTGLVMHVNETIQLNVYVDPSIWKNRLKVFYPDVTMDLFYPIMWAYEYTTMNNENVAQYQAGIIYSRWLQRASFGIAFGLGSLMIVFSIILVMVVKKRRPFGESYELSSSPLIINSEKM